MMVATEPGSAQRLAEVVAARLCHDMSGPLSILANALELARLESEGGGSPAGGSESSAMLREGAEAIAARLRLLRALFGPATGPFSAAEIDALVRGIVGGGRAEVDLSGLGEEASFPAELGRALLAALVLAGEALPRGGRIRCLGRPSDLAVAIEGTNAAWPAPLAAAIAGDDPVEAAISGGARAVMGPMLVMLARGAGFEPMLLMGSGVPLLRLTRADA